MHEQSPDTASATERAPMDADTLDFLRQVFNLVREGDSERLAGLIDKGMPVNFRNEKGDSLIMLASYHGRLDTVRVLLGRRRRRQCRQRPGPDPAGRRRL